MDSLEALMSPSLMVKCHAKSSLFDCLTPSYQSAGRENVAINLKIPQSYEAEKSNFNLQFLQLGQILQANG
jgi:hypothetical protein